jgi:lysozyme family protein
MSGRNYQVAKTFTIGQEGGYTNSPRDSGNWSSGVVGQGQLIGSNMGCGAPATIAYMADTEPGFVVTAEWMRNLPPTVYDGMAQTRYWQPLQIDSVPSGLDLSTFDSGWNIGIGHAAIQLQELVGAKQDGDIGPVTLGLIGNVPLGPLAHALGTADAMTLQTLLSVDPDGIVGPETLAALARMPLLCLRLSEIQAAYYRTLSNFSTYGDGWLARTGARLSAALALANT